MAARLVECKADALLVTSPANVRYLSGFTGSNGILLLTARETHFFTDPRYEIAAKKSIPGKVHIIKGPMIVGVSQVLRRLRLKKIGFESAWTHYDEYQRLQENLPLGASPVAVGRIIEQRRMLKSPAEIELIRESVNINSAAFTHTSVAVLDALNTFDHPVIEVHISNVHKREEFRHRSFVSLRADGVIAGCGTLGYQLGLRRIAQLLDKAA